MRKRISFLKRSLATHMHWRWKKKHICKTKAKLQILQWRNRKIHDPCCSALERRIYYYIRAQVRCVYVSGCVLPDNVGTLPQLFLYSAWHWNRPQFITKRVFFSFSRVTGTSSNPRLHLSHSLVRPRLSNSRDGEQFAAHKSRHLEIKASCWKSKVYIQNSDKSP